MTEQHLPSLQAQHLMLQVNLTKREYASVRLKWIADEITAEEVDQTSREMQAAQIALNKYIKELENGQAI